MRTIHRSRPTFLVILVTVALALGACTPAIGDRGTLAPRSPDATPPSEAPSPAPSEAVDPTPSDEPPASEAPTPTPTPQPTPTPAATPRPTPTPTPSGATSVKVYFLADGTLVPVHRSIDATRAVGRAAMTALLEGPVRAERRASPPITTAIPDGTELLGLDISGGLATVDLSGTFDDGGGSASMFARLAQVTYTLTQFPTVDRVAFRLDGEPVGTFSSEGIVLDGPSVRADFRDYLPPVFVDRPAWGGTLESPARLTGLANTFEAVFIVEVRNANGRTLVREPAMATCGTGCWGTFDLTVRFDVRSRQEGTLVVYTLSARDGSIEDLRTYPVTLVP